VVDGDGSPPPARQDHAVSGRGRVGKAAGEALSPGPSDEHLFRFGLELICEGVAALIARNQKKTERG
jgi:predicted phage tail protein